MGLSDRHFEKRGFNVKALRAPWSIRDKVQHRMMVKDANGYRRMKVHPMQTSHSEPDDLKYKAGSSVLTPKATIPHGNAVGYACVALAKDYCHSIRQSGWVY